MIRNMNSFCRREGRPPVAVMSGGGRSSHLFATIILLAGLIFGLSYLGTAWGKPILLWRIPDHHAFSKPEGAVVAPDGAVLVADNGNHQIVKINQSTRNSELVFGSLGNGDGQFKYPLGVAVDSSGNVYVADWGNDRIQKFGPLNNCAATLDNDLSLHIPILTFNGANYWADFQYVPNTLDVALIDANIVSDTSPYSSCTPASLSSDFKLHMPTVMFNGASYWLDLQYTVGLNFTFVNAGAN